MPRCSQRGDPEPAPPSLIKASTHPVNRLQWLVKLSALLPGLAGGCGARTGLGDAAIDSVYDGAVSGPAGSLNSGKAKFLQVSAGEYHACGVKTDNTVLCWGDSELGATSAPGGAFLQVSAGSLYTCGVKTDRTITCWGNNKNGQASPPGGTFSQVSTGGDVGAYFTCGLRTDGTLVCWDSPR